MTLFLVEDSVSSVFHSFLSSLAFRGTSQPDHPSGLTNKTPPPHTPNSLNQIQSILKNSVNSVRNHDDDGNLTNGHLPVDQSNDATLTWNGENRLTEVHALTEGADPSLPSAAADPYYLLSTYQYDFLSRRYKKTTGSTTEYCNYDGWNPQAEYTGYTLYKSYTWGMDIGGQRSGRGLAGKALQSAGGVGGLLAVEIHNVNTATDGACYPYYDANGNIMGYTSHNAPSHKRAISFEYDSFGNTIKTTESQTGIATHLTHCFSTKRLDAETGLCYYGYRYYNPVMGRWSSRDPIEEKGGFNLYGFVHNNGIALIDVLGFELIDARSCSAVHRYSNEIELGKFKKLIGVSFKFGMRYWIKKCKACCSDGKIEEYNEVGGSVYGKTSFKDKPLRINGIPAGVQNIPILGDVGLFWSGEVSASGSFEYKPSVCGESEEVTISGKIYIIGGIKFSLADSERFKLNARGEVGGSGEFMGVTVGDGVQVMVKVCVQARARVQVCVWDLGAYDYIKSESKFGKFNLFNFGARGVSFGGPE